MRLLGNLFKPAKRIRAIELNNSHWADSIEGHVKRDVAINMGMFAADHGMGYLLKISDIDWSGDVRENYRCTVLAEYASTWSSDSDETVVKSMEFRINAESYSIRSIFEATIYALEITEVKKGEYKMSRKYFRKKYRLVD